MRSQKLIPVQGVSRMAGWTQWNPLISTENRPVDISSVFMVEHNLLWDRFHRAAETLEMETISQGFWRVP